MSGPPLVSCVITTYNSERFLDEAIASILSQTYPAIEILVVDDGSTDATSAIAGRYEDRIRLIQLDNAGPPAARNRGMAEAAGDLIAFLDADDLWDPKKIALQVERLAADPTLGYAVTYAKLFWSEELAGEQEAFRDHPRAKPVPGYAASTWLVRRSAFDRVGPLREDLFFGDVVEWFARADRLGIAGAVVPDVLVSRRMHAANLTRRRRRDGREYLVEFVKAELQRRRLARDASPSV